jgi:hypothetical protein
MLVGATDIMLLSKKGMFYYAKIGCQEHLPQSGKYL